MRDSCTLFLISFSVHWWFLPESATTVMVCQMVIFLFPLLLLLYLLAFYQKESFPFSSIDLICVDSWASILVTNFRNTLNIMNCFYVQTLIFWPVRTPSRGLLSHFGKLSSCLLHLLTVVGWIIVHIYPHPNSLNTPGLCGWAHCNHKGPYKGRG